MTLGSQMRRFSLGCVIACFLLAGCEKEPTRPGFTSVNLEVKAVPSAGAPGTPVSLPVLVRNVGWTRVWHCSGCGCGNGVFVTVLGPDGSQVFLTDPNGPYPACADWLNTPLDPAQTLEGGARFTGVLYQRDTTIWPTPTYPAPSGTYTATAQFSYRSDSGTWTRLSRTITFTWHS